jgi:hypothetical protein
MTAGGTEVGLRVQPYPWLPIGKKLKSNGRMRKSRLFLRHYLSSYRSILLRSIQPLVEAQVEIEVEQQIEI